MTVKVQPPTMNMPIGTVDKAGNVYLSDYGHRHLFDAWKRSGGFDDFVAQAILAGALGDATLAALAAQLEDVDSDTKRLSAQTETVSQAVAEVAAENQDAVANLRALLQSVTADDLLQAVADINSQINAIRAQIESIRGEDTLSAIQTLTTDQVNEGFINLYFTVTRARTSISATGSLAYNTSTGVLSYTTPNSDGITEGTTNLYFTIARARASVSASGDLSYNSTTGVFSYTTPANSATATKWATPRTLSFIGNVTGSGSVDGSTNVATTLTIANGAVTTAMLAFTLATVATTGAYTDLTGRPTLGTAAAQNTGTSGGNVPLLNGANTWASAQTFSTEISQGVRTLGVAVQAGTYTIKDAAGNPVTLLTT